METEVTTTSPIVVSPSTPQTPTLAPAKHRASRKSATSTTPAFLSNLGRANLRGIRKCPQCGVYNGTRGLSCKNKACGITLRNPTSSSSTTNSAGGRSGKKCVVEVVRVIIDSEERGSGKERVGGTGGVQVFSVCHKGRGATATQLGFVELVPTDTAIATGDGATLLTRINLGRCFLPSCRQGQRSSQAHNESESLSATASGSKQSSDSLCIHIKQAIECRTPATPLTLKSSVLEGLQASSQAREELWRLALESPGPLVQRIAKDTLVVKCHTDSQHPLGLLHLTVGAAGLSEGGKSQRRSGKEQQQHAGVFHCACQAGGKRGKADIEGAGGSTSSPQPCLHFYACVCAFTSDEKLASEFTAFINYTPSALQQNVTSRVISPGSTQAVDERTLTFGFHQWLAGVTERIHQTMNYQFDGKPQPLVYHVPQEFFNALQHRLSLGSKKKRLPNFTTAFVRSDGLPPLGPFFKYTWHITNLMHVKHIFDTPELPLELYQSFVKNVDGSYSSFHCPEPPPEPEVPEGQRADRPHAIRPMELRTFLRVGPGSADEKEAGPFVMEWTPDVLPRCQMGELRISFEFGHQQSGQAENAEKTVSAEKGTRNSSQPKLKTALEVLQLVV